MNRIYSPEPISEVLLSKTGDNGDLINTTSFNREIKKSTIFIEIKNSKKLRPTVYRGYYSEYGELVYNKTTYTDIEPNVIHTNITFDDDIINVENYVTYYISFESLADGNVVDIDMMGVVFSDFEATKNNTISYSCNLLSDINNKPLSYQHYNKTQSFTLLINRSDFEEILSVVQKPYYLVNVISDCLDNSTKKLIEQNINRSYITSSSKMCFVTIDNIVGK